MAQCYYHPEVETNLACGKCGRYVCPRCMVQTPVGVRCRECAQLRRLPTFDVRATTYLRAVLAGGAIAGATGAIWGLLMPRLAFLWGLPSLVVLGIAYLIGEGVSLAANRKRGTGLAVIAGASLALTIGVSAVVSRESFFLIQGFLNNIFGIFFLLIAFYVAISRLR